MMEGISSEAASLAGHWKLSNLCWIYDNNHITIEGNTALAFTEDVATRFLGYGWNVTRVGDANDLDLLDRAFSVFLKRARPADADHRRQPHRLGRAAQAGHQRRPRRAPGRGRSPADQAQLRLARGRQVPGPRRRLRALPRGHRPARQGSCATPGSPASSGTRPKHPDLADQLYRMQHRQLPDGWDKDLPAFPADPKGMATRISSGKVLNAVAKNVPWLIGGAADLAPSTKTRLTFDGAGDFEAGNYAGRNFHFGVREHAMGAIMNGMALVKVRPFGSGFLIFSDYGRMPIRLAAIMEIPVIYVFTHDSIGVGEDGPTHQPIEQLASLRAIPGLIVLRPADANEVVEAWKVIMQLHHQPAAIWSSRVRTCRRSTARKYAPASGLAKGAYVLADAPDGKPDVLLLATGSEVSLCVEAYEKLNAEGIRSRVVSMPSWELFDDQDAAYRDSVLPPDVTARVSVEQASVFGWASTSG